MPLLQVEYMSLYIHSILLSYFFLLSPPYLELNNNYQSYVPIEHNIIRDIVWEVYEVDDFDLGKTFALPDVCADIMTFYTVDMIKIHLFPAYKAF